MYPLGHIVSEISSTMQRDALDAAVEARRIEGKRRIEAASIDGPRGFWKVCFWKVGVDTRVHTESS